MVTGDNSATARAIAGKTGIGPNVLPKSSIENIMHADVLAEVFPQDKLQIVKALQKNGLVCGMTGDGVNDAPALRQAEVGIAVSNAADVAKAAASIILTRPGLTDIVKAVQCSRRIYQRMVTYTLNKIIKTLEIAVLLGVGLLATGHFIISQLLIVLLLFTNDFVTMSIATDNTLFSPKPDRWNIGKLMQIGGLFAALILLFSFSVLFVGEKILELPLPQIQTLIFLTLVFSGQANVYLVRERGHFWSSRPSVWMMASSALDILAVGCLALLGIWMAPLPFSIVGLLLLAALIYYFCLDFLKVKILRLASFRGARTRG